MDSQGIQLWLSEGNKWQGRRNEIFTGKPIWHLFFFLSFKQFTGRTIYVNLTTWTANFGKSGGLPGFPIPASLLVNHPPSRINGVQTQANELLS